MDDDALWPYDDGPSGDPGHSPVGPVWLVRGQGSSFGTSDAERMGLDRNTVEGAQIHFFAQLDGSNPLHRLVAWVALFLMFGLPLLPYALALLY